MDTKTKIREILDEINSLSANHKAVKEPSLDQALRDFKRTISVFRKRPNNGNLKKCEVKSMLLMSVILNRAIDNPMALSESFLQATIQSFGTLLTECLSLLAKQASNRKTSKNETHAILLTRNIRIRRNVISALEHGDLSHALEQLQKETGKL